MCIRDSNTLGSAENRAAYRDALRTYFAPYARELSDTSRQRLETNPLRILDTKDEREQHLLDDAPRLDAFLDDESRVHFDAVRSLLDAAGIAYDLDPLLVRGLDYYGRTTWELEAEGIGAQSSLAGGGRYDGLAPALGHDAPIPAVGFGAGLERLFLALDAVGYAFPTDDAPAAVVVTMRGGDAAAFALAQRLRRDGLAVAQTLEPGSFKRLMKDAERSGAPVALLVGETEAAEGTVVVKPLTGSGEQRTVPDADVAAALRPSILA